MTGGGPKQKAEEIDRQEDLTFRANRLRALGFNEYDLPREAPMSDLTKHFVTFYSPGTFVSEETTKPIDSWDVETAVIMAADIKERHGALPYGFRFSTRSRGPDDLDSKVTERSNMYYLGGKIETLAEVEARNDPKEEILRSNMRINGYDRIVVNDNSWRFTAPLHKGDVVIGATP